MTNPSSVAGDAKPATGAADKPRAVSLRRYLLAGILLPVCVMVALNTFSLYRETLGALNTAYDRTLLASAKSIGEQLDVTGFDEQGVITVAVPYAALEAFEADNQSRMFYRISTLQGTMISGFAELPVWHGTIPARPPYSALVDFYDEVFRGDDVRVAVLLQPVASHKGRAMAVIQVAETLELRKTLARKILFDTLWRQVLLVAVIALVAVVVVQRATRPVRRLSRQLQSRHEGDLTPIAAPDAPRELLPLVDATNDVMHRLQHLLDHQKRFVRDAAHQLRTPLAVLKVQVQSALRGDIEAPAALAEINQTVDRATLLANQMLALAKVEQLRHAGQATRDGEADVASSGSEPGAGGQVLDLSLVVRQVALDLSPLIAARNIDFEISTQAAPIRSHEWMLGELARNLLHNAIKHTPPDATLAVRVVCDERFAALTISDSGPGISQELAARLYQPFSAGNVRQGSGLGLAICREITDALGGSITLDNRLQHGHVAGLDATVRLPLADSAA